MAIAEGSTVAEATRRIGVTGQTYCHWRSEYGGLRIEQAGRLKRQESENSRLKRAVADLEPGQIAQFTGLPATGA